MTPDIQDDEDDILEDGPAPATTIAGPQTQSQQVNDRIRQVRVGGGQPDEQDPHRDPAMQFAKNTALSSGVGRALNSLAAGTGAKVDNSAYDELDKQTNIPMKELDRSRLVQKAIQDRQAKSDLLDKTLGQKQATLDASQDNQQAKMDAYNHRTDTMGKLAGSRSDAANIRTANTILNDKNSQTEVRKLQAARSAQSLVDDIRNGKLIGSKNISKQLTNMIATIEMGSPGGQGDRQAMGVDTLYGKLKGALGYLKGGPEDVIPSAYLDQLESETHALGDRAAANYKNITEGALNGADLSAGNPDADTGKVYTLAKQRRDVLMKSNGYDPETGKPINPRDKGSAAASPHGGKYPPGSVVKVKGKKYVVAPDGNTLQEQTQEASL